MASRPLLSLLALGFLLLPAVSSVLAAPPAPKDAPKTIILGFDGMDYSLTKQFMDEGLLPNLKRLSEEGAFRPLEPANPPESPVSWAVFNTGQNPGKTGIESFITRTIARGSDGQPIPGMMPMPGSPLLGVKTEIELSQDTAVSSFARESPVVFVVTVGLCILAAVFALAGFLLKLPAVPALLMGLLLGGTGAWVANDYTTKLPFAGKVPWEINPMQGTHWWKHLDDAGVRTVAIGTAQTYPPDSEGPRTKMLSGLGVKDVGGSPGKWFVFTDDPWTIEKGTGSGGDVVRIFFDEMEEGRDGVPRVRAKVELKGPANWLADNRYKERIAALEAAKNDSSHTTSELDRVERELSELQSEYQRWRRRNRVVTADFSVTADRANGRATFAIAGHEKTIGVGEWTEYLRVRFPFDDRRGESGLVRFHLLRCDEQEVRFLVPPVNIDPYDPPHIPISSPAGFCTDLAHGIGEPYETLGWACLTNPLKDMIDSGFEIQSFMDDIGETMAWREKVLAHVLDDPSSWDVFFQLESTVDRVGHMLFREFDADHPVHDPVYAAKEVTCWGRTFPLSRALPEIYMQVDRIVGGVMDRIASGSLGRDVALLLVADHGFTSFRREVNLNNLLLDFGYLAFKNPEVAPRGKGLNDLDWDRTRAYSIGLGRIYINKLGRENSGIVTDEEYDELCASIRRDLLSVTDGEGGPSPVVAVWRRDELYSGDWVVENEGGLQYRFLGDRTHPVGPFDGMGDLSVGFAPYYRIAWATGFGAFDSTAITNNTGHWSGDHVSVHPEHVPGIFFSNRKLASEADCKLIDIGPTVVTRHGVDAAQTDMDGKVLPLQGFAR